MIKGADSDDYTADAIAVGDVSSDGIPDLVIGTLGGDGPDNRDRTPTTDGTTGEAAVLLGPFVRGAVLDLRTDVDLLVTGRGLGDALGNTLALGDLSGDGVSDIAIGCIWSDGIANDRPSAGDAHVVFSRLAGACRLRMSEIAGVRVSKVEADRFRISFDERLFPEPDSASLYAGTIASLRAGAYDHQAVAGGCAVVGNAIEVASDDAPGTYWLVAATCRDGMGLYEGPLGSSVSRAGTIPRPSAAQLGNAACM